MVTRIVSYLSIGLILVGITVFIYQTYWITIGFQSINEQEVKASYSPPQQGKTIKTVNQDPPEEGTKLGILTIPKLDRTLPIFQGASEEILKKGVGHISSTPLPGEESNSVLSAHRDTFFRQLDSLVVGDKLIVNRSDVSFIYKIKRIRIVNKNDKTVIVPKPKSTLTLTTCYPFTYIGPAPQRYIIEAELITKPKIEQ
ncbi:class D sortase [Metabacillus endolithicus]|uniref:Class D sortase n=1 Tax=Metabacillus endolithicus TaxID=1535204 RepID=A0ABW5BU20_9BACI|nr:class D sortase [Metabacillus endolithicus]UPG62942.1 class D sortase [Metabacillus endolithicus]